MGHDFKRKVSVMGWGGGLSDPIKRKGLREGERKERKEEARERRSSSRQNRCHAAVSSCR